ncbi:MAG: hypothetical protein KKE30_09130 [Gammaproteobacteria bacterium]|nr:hypothetical protein [Gammaproteobacteria bacterium]MBU1556937.1 hypothetical protein [Gammaproteobacteria bacterium]MBU2069344.1 hypothetical protein [Gammaproteobacteria bacterium]MBU2183397.1 hypothetical protein [Gammaproteobacteria bacterium]MBU2204554.1 hypothetical protein [Gammaproteobacteria bacterium]
MKQLILCSVMLLLQWWQPALAATRHDSSQKSQPELSRYALDFYTNRVADNLFRQLNTELLPRVAAPQLSVASFLPLNSLELTAADADERALANQLADSMLSHALAKGYKAYDYRLRSELLLLSGHEQALSRQAAELSTGQLANAILSGSYVMQEDGYVINARIIDVSTKQVLAAVTDYIPGNVFWSEQQVKQRGDYLYRSSRGEK